MEIVVIFSTVPQPFTERRYCKRTSNNRYQSGNKISNRFSGHIEKNTWKPSFESAVLVGTKEARTSYSR